MANINGTNGGDNLVGTAHTDRLTPLLGFDWVDGGAGQDTLVLDYRASGTAGYSYSYVYSVGGSFAGYFQSGDGQNSVSLQNIERLEVKLDNGDGTFSLDGSALAHGATVDVDAGGGLDTLEANFSSLVGISFAVGPNEKAKLGSSNFSNFENYHLTLGAGSDHVQLGAGDDLVIAGDGDDTLGGGSGNDALYGEGGHNILTGGDGDDSLVSSGVDTADGGAGYDYWQGDYRFATDNLSLTYNGSSGSLSNGTIFTNVENVFFLSGAGDDLFTISGGGLSPEGAHSVGIYAGAGYDTLSADLADGAAGREFISISREGTSFTGVAGGVFFSDFEQASFTGDDGDRASLALFFDDGLNVVVQADGTLTTNVGITLFNYDRLDIQLGEGNDSVAGGAKRDVISGMGGDDTIAGGGGGDAMFGGSGADTFVMNSIDDFGIGRPVDEIWDFSAEEGDKIDVQNVIAGEFTFVGGDEFSASGAAELRTEDFGSGFTAVQGDANGDGVMDFWFVVSATGTLSASDFIL